jgi:hypothetical protein
LVSEIMNRKVMLMGKVDKLLKKDNDDNAWSRKAFNLIDETGDSIIIGLT